MRYSLAFIILSAPAFANPYFRVLDISHPQPVVGALIDSKDLKKTAAASLLPLITHSPSDGQIIPSIGEDWAPIAVGASINAGKATLDVGPLFNVLPWIRGAALAITPQKWQGLIQVLSPSPDQGVTFSAGPVFEYEQLSNKGYLKFFSGVALHF